MNALGMKMIFVRPAWFVSGTMPNPRIASWYEWADETPRRVDMTEPYFLAQFPVTNEQLSPDPLL